MSNFQVVFLFFQLSLPNIWHAQPIQSFVFKINKDRSIISQSLQFQVKNCGLKKHLKWGDFYHIFTKSYRKAHGGRMVGIVTYNSGFINYNILKTSKDRSKTRVHEFVRGPLNMPPPPLDNAVRSKQNRSGRVKHIGL